MTLHRKIVTVFGSSRPRPGETQYSAARELGGALARQKFIVCSGGYAGTMEAVSRGAKEAGGRTIGITANFFKARANQFIDEEIREKTWQDRLFALIDRGDAFVACPGGTGTLVELAVVWEMLNKRVVNGKPLVVLGEFWHPIIVRIREIELGHKTRWGENQESLIHRADSPANAATFLAEYFAKPRAPAAPDSATPSADFSCALLSHSQPSYNILINDPSLRGIRVASSTRGSRIRSLERNRRRLHYVHTRTSRYRITRASARRRRARRGIHANQ